MGSLISQTLQDYLEPTNQLDLHLLTHSHYDHLGCTPLLKQRYPQLSIGAHPILADIIQRPNAIQLIRTLNDTFLNNVTPELKKNIILFETFPVDLFLKDQEILDLGGISIQVIYTPGHTRDSISFYIPEAKALIPGEATGIPDRTGNIMPEFLQSYTTYLKSLEKLTNLDIDYLCLPHNYALQGEEAKTYISQSIAATIAFKNTILETLHITHGSIDQALKHLMNQLYTADIGQPKDSFTLNLQAMIKTVVKEFGNDASFKPS
ncbi:2-aminobenzoylacetyl-CoA thioesterase-like [Ylistrum balloti]|uniref:2-aminobenzoylacetyl-CoA thioesterase-like n=1 Tax=Ylistrum balloti TaxID=509963 RepID=UPI002905A8DB|nr:2-aminobenzoylacetyl-CoA thioesterase-like [Ylistrum balloti]